MVRPPASPNLLARSLWPSCLGNTVTRTVKGSRRSLVCSTSFLDVLVKKDVSVSSQLRALHSDAQNRTMTLNASQRMQFRTAESYRYFSSSGAQEESSSETITDSPEGESDKVDVSKVSVSKEDEHHEETKRKKLSEVRTFDRRCKHKSSISQLTLSWSDLTGNNHN